MRLLLVTEKCGAPEKLRDGGARLVETLQRAFGVSAQVMQFGPQADPSATWHFDYPCNAANRFERRLANAEFIATRVKAVEKSFTHVIFIHISMQFGLFQVPLDESLDIWTFPMFLTPSYRASGESVPESYFERERLALAYSSNILTPSYLEKRQLMDFYFIPEEKIHVIPRGIDTRFLSPRVRSLKGPPLFCSVGSIKPQKNTLGLIQLFAEAHSRFPGSRLQLIGPIQDSGYAEQVQAKIKKLKLEECIEWTGYIPPHQLAAALASAHLHLSTSTCETFGRSIFETLALGLPNIARATENAAAEFLQHLPYAKFTDNHEKALEFIEEMLGNLHCLSALALEIGELYDDQMLSRFLTAKISGRDPIVVSDFDGTLYHKDDPEKTQRCMEAFRSYPQRIVCSARGLQDLLAQLGAYKLTVDWIVASSGAVVADGSGKPIWLTPLDPETVSFMEREIPVSRKIELHNNILQIAVLAQEAPSLFGLRSEIYEGMAFIAHWRASKLHAVHRLLRTIGWAGQVRAFGDGPYDQELLTYFDGTFITPASQKEVSHVTL